MARAKYEIISVGLNEQVDVILLADLDGPVSVTNDAEAVVEEVIKWITEFHNSKRPFKIHYLDSMGRRDELCHDGKKFTGFAPVDPAPETA